MKAGLTSITFRDLAVPEIVRLAAKARINGIEWGSDVHVPHGDVEAARVARQETLNVGLEVSSYGSYYRAGDDESPQFKEVLDTAKALGAQTIRVWAGQRGSGNCGSQYRVRVVENLRKIAEMAGAADIKVACEYHGGTLTDDDESAQALMSEVAHDNLGLYWQPRLRQEHGDRCDALKALLPHLSNLHVFHWVVTDDKKEARPLAEAEALWQDYLKIAAIGGVDRWALLEFVPDNSPEQFLRSAEALRTWLGFV